MRSVYKGVGLLKHDSIHAQHRGGTVQCVALASPSATLLFCLKDLLDGPLGLSLFSHDWGWLLLVEDLSWKGVRVCTSEDIYVEAVVDSRRDVQFHRMAPYRLRDRVFMAYPAQRLRGPCGAVVAQMEPYPVSYPNEPGGRSQILPSWPGSLPKQPGSSRRLWSVFVTGRPRAQMLAASSCVLIGASSPSTV